MLPDESWLTFCDTAQLFPVDRCFLLATLAGADALPPGAFRHIVTEGAQ
jgi:hypothetical protein